MREEEVQALVIFLLLLTFFSGVGIAFIESIFMALVLGSAAALVVGAGFRWWLVSP